MNALKYFLFDLLGNFAPEFKDRSFVFKWVLQVMIFYKPVWFFSNNQVRRDLIFVFKVNQTYLDNDSVKSILSEYKISNADIILRQDATEDDLIDVIEGNR